MVGFSQPAGGNGRPGADPLPDDDASDAPLPEGPPEAFVKLLSHWAELREYASYYLAARLDGMKLKLVRIGTLIAFGSLGAVFGTAVLATAAVLLLGGLAEGVGLLCGGRLWLGQIIVGSVVVVIGFGTVWFMLRHLVEKMGHGLIEKYERRKERERAAFGRDVAKRATSPTDL